MKVIQRADIDATRVQAQGSGFTARYYPWYVAGVLLLAYVCSFVDRTIINLLVTPIKQDLNLSDTQVSLLQGIAFALFYVTAGLYIGRLADKYSRRIIITVGLILWCFATAGGSIAASFMVLFMMRVLVGVGESSLTPSATSILGDIFPKDRIGTAMAIYSVGPYLGIGLSMIIGGALIDHLMAQPEIVVPLLGNLRPWQAAFLIVGLPGLTIAALVFFTIHEPERKEVVTSHVEPLAHVKISDVLQYMKTHFNVYGRIFLGAAMLSLVGYGISAWLPTYYLRVFDTDNTEIGRMIGVSVMIGGPIGVIAGGIIGDWFQKRRTDGPVLIGMAAALGTLVFASGIVLTGTMFQSSLMIVFAYIFKGIPQGMYYVAIYLTTPNRMRAQVTAIYLFVDASIGLGFGPTAIALFTDYVYRDEALIGYSLLSVIVITCTIAFFCFFTVKKSFNEMVAGENI